ncbi:MAG: hypothetical protein U1D41_11340 [Nitrosomonas sp.]|uniref:hypothetical protein n=1 Tax=Nitrosomonas sp. TaxID=42353 RepID=UPI00271B8D22|nr:hypothetical protein [Nitrosomonas sp.]MDO8894244.1 hypothetical protein [Nitrosomonas sp.]MDP3280947.1 hypothetical protein [Nitrosomonas sp.]MDP3662111.1 hypothetical protein [Nitrosomonas sp.]MDZ4106734.1 hypothetical protein [Nitrosomonas sp.]
MAEKQSLEDQIKNQMMDKLVLEDQGGVLCTAEADEYFMGIKGELNQIDRLVSDAVNNLVINFRYISKLTKSHHDMVLAIEKMAAPEGSKPILELLDKQMDIAGKIEQELEMAITSLQFGDLVTQLLAHTTHQVEILNIELQRIDRQGNWKKRVEEESLRTIHEGISKAVDVAKIKSKRKPVVQQGMQMGDIELF